MSIEEPKDVAGVEAPVIEIPGDGLGEELPVLELVNKRLDLHYKIWANGRITGLQAGFVIYNRMPDYLAQIVEPMANYVADVQEAIGKLAQGPDITNRELRRLKGSNGA